MLRVTHDVAEYIDSLSQSNILKKNLKSQEKTANIVKFYKKNNIIRLFAIMRKKSA
jgi:hypothetical protein